MKEKTKEVKLDKVADEIWKSIKDLPIEMFSLPNQFVRDHVKPKGGLSDALVVTLKSPAVLPSLESVLNSQKQTTKTVSSKMKAEGENITEVHPKYVMQETDNYIIIKKFQPVEDVLVNNLAPVFIAGK